MVHTRQSLAPSQRSTRSNGDSGATIAKPNRGRGRSAKRQKENIAEGRSRKRAKRAVPASAPVESGRNATRAPQRHRRQEGRAAEDASGLAEAQASGDPLATSRPASSEPANRQAPHPLEPEGDPLLWFDPSDGQKVQDAKAVLQVSADSDAPTPLARDVQYRKMEDVLSTLVSEGRGGSLYVSGLPGTGKTYTIGKLLKSCSSWTADPVSVVWINCMSLSQPKQVFQRLLNGVAEAGSRSAQACRADPIVVAGPTESSSHGAKDSLGSLRKALAGGAAPSGQKKRRRSSIGGGAAGGGPRTVVAVLDEMDCLQTGDQAVLSELFQLAAGGSSRLVLVGISNSIDLTDRTLPHLEQLGISPAVVPFPAYSAKALFELLKERLDQLPGPVFAEPAMQFASRKVGSGAGDMRQLLQASQRAIDNAAAEAKEKEKSAAEAPPPCEEDAAAAADAPPEAKKPRLVGIVHMASGIAQLQGQCGTQGGVKSIKSLSREQQTVLCAVVRCHNDPQNAAGMLASAPAAAINPRRLSGAFRQMKGKQFPKAPRLSLGASCSAADRKDFNMADVQDMYRRLTRSAQVPAMRASEFSSVCSNLADQALIQISPGMHDRMRRVSLKISQDDVVMALQGIGLFRQMLDQ